MAYYRSKVKSMWVNGNKMDYIRNLEEKLLNDEKLIDELKIVIKGLHLKLNDQKNKMAAMSRAD